MQISRRTRIATVVMLLGSAFPGNALSDGRRWENLIGLKAVSARVQTELAFLGAENLGVDPRSIQVSVIGGLDKAGVLDRTSTDLPTVWVYVSGRGSSDREGDYRIRLALIARMPSPFQKGRYVEAILWEAERGDSLVMAFNPETRSLDRPVGLLLEKLNADCLGLVADFVLDVRKANPAAPPLPTPAE